MADNNINPNPQETIAKFEEAWTDKMTQIWREKLEYFHAIDSGHLYSSIKGSVSFGPTTHIEHSFALYGLYVNNGTGIFYEKDNGGDLQFLDPIYRHRYGLDMPKRVGPAWGGRVAGGKPRKPRVWIYRRYYASCKKLQNVIAELTAEDAVGLTIRALECIFDKEGQMTTSQSRFVK